MNCTQIMVIRWAIMMIRNLPSVAGVGVKSGDIKEKFVGVKVAAAGEGGEILTIVQTRRSSQNRRSSRRRSSRIRRSRSSSNDTFDPEVENNHKEEDGDEVELDKQNSINCNTGGGYASQPIDVELSIRLSQQSINADDRVSN